MSLLVCEAEKIGEQMKEYKQQLDALIYGENEDTDEKTLDNQESDDESEDDEPMEKGGYDDAMDDFDRQEQIRKLQERYNTSQQKCIQIYKELCSSPVLSEKDKEIIILSFIKYIPEEAYDIISRWRDSIQHLRGNAQKNIIDLMIKLAKSSDLNGHQRTMTAVCLYNYCFIEHCYDCFFTLAMDKLLNVKYRVEACRYLFASGEDVNLQTSQECLLEIIEDTNLSSEYRYGVIAGFISKTGISTLLNFGKLKVPSNPDFVYALQTAFFYNNTNNVRERILSGQYMLQMESDIVPDSEKRDVANILLSFAQNVEYEQDIRADAADVLMREAPDSSFIEKARDIIKELGYSQLSGKSVSSRIKTIYSNSQNVHNEQIAECVNKFIEDIIVEKNRKKLQTPEFSQVHTDITKLSKIYYTEPEDIFFIARALNRLSVDTASFTSYKATLCDILCNVVARIETYKKDKKIVLQKRLLEELKDMSGTCSSGYASRLVNVLSVFDANLRISYQDQIKSNIDGRLKAMIRDHPNEEERGKIALGMMDGADKDDKQFYITFITRAIEKLKTDLHKEFVGDGYINEKDFIKHFTSGAKDWLIVV